MIVTHPSDTVNTLATLFSGRRVVIVAQLAVRCDECQAQHRSPHVTTVTKVGDATIEDGQLDIFGGAA